MNKNSRILVFEKSTLLGGALARRLVLEGYTKVHATGGERYRGQALIDSIFDWFLPEYVFLAAGKSGGIRANMSQPAELMLDNLQVVTQVIDASHRYGVRRLLYLASSCSYPRDCPQPLFPEYLLRGPLEPSNEAYAVAKVAGIKLCEAYRAQYGSDFLSAIPSNPFGPGGDFSLDNSHVIPALIRKIHAAKIAREPKVELWGTGRPRRDFIFSEDAAAASIAIMRDYKGTDPINISCGGDITISALAETVREIIAYDGELNFDPELPDGMPVKVLDAAPLAALGWQAEFTLREAIAECYRDYLERFFPESADRPEHAEVCG